MSVKIVLDRSVVSALLNSKGAEDVCVSLAVELAARCGPDYTAAPPHKTGQRVAVDVVPANEEASDDNIANDTLRRSVQSMEMV